MAPAAVGCAGHRAEVGRPRAGRAVVNEQRLGVRPVVGFLNVVRISKVVGSVHCDARQLDVVAFLVVVVLLLHVHCGVAGGVREVQETDRARDPVRDNPVPEVLQGGLLSLLLRGLRKGLWTCSLPPVNEVQPSLQISCIYPDIQNLPVCRIKKRIISGTEDEPCVDHSKVARVVWIKVPGSE